jgi:hypothetical protein
VIVFAHPGHWISWIVFVAPPLILILGVVVVAVRDRMRGDGEGPDREG